MEFFNNCCFFVKINVSSRRYADLDGLLVHLYTVHFQRRETAFHYKAMLQVMFGHRVSRLVPVVGEFDYPYCSAVGSVFQISNTNTFKEENMLFMKHLKLLKTSY